MTWFMRSRSNRRSGRESSRDRVTDSFFSSKRGAIMATAFLMSTTRSPFSLWSSSCPTSARDRSRRFWIRRPMRRASSSMERRRFLSRGNTSSIMPSRLLLMIARGVRSSCAIFAKSCRLPFSASSRARAISLKVSVRSPTSS